VTARRSTSRLVLAALLVVLAALLVLLAHDAWRWNRAMREADTRATLGPVGAGAWQASTLLPSGLVRRALGIDDDLEFRRTAARTLALSRKVEDAPSKQRILVQTMLARISETDPDHARASRAADLLGLMIYANRSNPQQVISPYVNPKDAANGATPDQTPEEKAMAEFAIAIRLDPTNADAKRHLELLLHQRPPPSEKVSPRPGSGEHTGTKGSGSRPAGYGY
jgi:hypothetical protein